MTSIAPTQDGVQIALRSFLISVLPSDVEVVVGVQNRVPEPAARFVVMVPIRFTRLRTNIDAQQDVRFTGSIAADVLTVTDVSFGTIRADATVFGIGLVPNTKIVVQLTGTPGQAGTYRVDKNQTLASTVLAAGQRGLEQGAEVVVQLDFHAADNTASDFAQTVSTALRDPFGVEQFAQQDPNYGVVPLYADDPRYAPFINEAQAYEWRWTLDAHLQVNQVLAVGQQYADALAVDVKSVDATFPP